MSNQTTDRPCIEGCPGCPLCRPAPLPSKKQFTQERMEAALDWIVRWSIPPISAVATMKSGGGHAPTEDICEILGEAIKRWEANPPTSIKSFSELQIDRLRHERDQAMAVIGEMAALVPLSETIEATRTGAALVQWFKDHLRPAPETPAARTPQDYAIEHGEYLAKSAEDFLIVLNDVCMAEQKLSTWDEDDPEYADAKSGVDTAWERRHDHWQGLQNAIYEFRKRAERAKRPAPETTGCTRSHPHENMSPECARLTELVRSNAQNGTGYLPVSESEPCSR